MLRETPLNRGLPLYIFPILLRKINVRLHWNGANAMGVALPRHLGNRVRNLTAGRVSDDDRGLEEASMVAYSSKARLPTFNGTTT
jgi:hypothetical protein